MIGEKMSEVRIFFQVMDCFLFGQAMRCPEWDRAHTGKISLSHTTPRLIPIQTRRDHKGGKALP